MGFTPRVPILYARVGDPHHCPVGGITRSYNGAMVRLMEVALTLGALAALVLIRWLWRRRRGRADRGFDVVPPARRE
jgi:hypothetical protein